MSRKDPNQGEGDRISARRYDRHVEEFVAGRAERAARRPPRSSGSVIAGLFAIGRAYVHRLRQRITAATQKR